MLTGHFPRELHASTEEQASQKKGDYSNENTVRIDTSSLMWKDFSWTQSQLEYFKNNFFIGILFKPLYNIIPLNGI